VEGDAAVDAALVEAIIYLESDAVDEKMLAAATGLDKERIERALQAIREIYADPRHGVELIGVAGGYTFAPKASLAEPLQARYGKRNENRLSRAALETLSIVAYSQPVTRAEIEGIRGVSAEGMVKLLTERDLIKVVGKRDAPGKPVEYGTTREFLKLFRLASISELPKLDEVDREKYAGEE
jgi:segregation and condensation protein B